MKQAVANFMKMDEMAITRRGQNGHRYKKMALNPCEDTVRDFLANEPKSFLASHKCPERYNILRDALPKKKAAPKVEPKVEPKKKDEVVKADV